MLFFQPYASTELTGKKHLRLLRLQEEWTSKHLQAPNTKNYETTGVLRIYASSCILLYSSFGDAHERRGSSNWSFWRPSCLQLAPTVTRFKHCEKQELQLTNCVKTAIWMLHVNTSVWTSDWRQLLICTVTISEASCQIHCLICAVFCALSANRPTTQEKTVEFLFTIICVFTVPHLHEMRVR